MYKDMSLTAGQNPSKSRTCGFSTLHINHYAVRAVKCLMPILAVGAGWRRLRKPQQQRILRGHQEAGARPRQWSGLDDDDDGGGGSDISPRCAW